MCVPLDDLCNQQTSKAVDTKTKEKNTKATTNTTEWWFSREIKIITFFSSIFLNNLRFYTTRTPSTAAAAATRKMETTTTMSTIQKKNSFSNRSSLFFPSLGLGPIWKWLSYPILRLFLIRLHYTNTLFRNDGIGGNEWLTGWSEKFVLCMCVCVFFGYFYNGGFGGAHRIFVSTANTQKINIIDQFWINFT